MSYSNEEEVMPLYENKAAHVTFEEGFNDFSKFVTPFIESHPIPNFDLMIAKCLSPSIYARYCTWKSSSAAINQPSASQVDQLLRLWKAQVGTRSATPINFISRIRNTEFTTDIIEKIETHFVADDSTVDLGAEDDYAYKFYGSRSGSEPFRYHSF